MRRRINLPGFLAFLLIFSSCSRDGFIKTPSGLRYKIVRAGSGPAFDQGDYVVFNMEYYDENDSILYSSVVRESPVVMHYDDSVWSCSGQAYDGLRRFRVGDSAVMIVNCLDLYQRSFRMPIPRGLDPESSITFRIGVVRKMNENEFREYEKKRGEKIRAEQANRVSGQLIEDEGIIDRVLDDRKIIPLETESGLRYIIKREGQGPRPRPGDRVVVNFTAALLDSTVFEASARLGKPFEFILGAGEEPRGWEEGIGLMNKGSHFVFFIPSPLGYGVPGRDT